MNLNIILKMLGINPAEIDELKRVGQDAAIKAEKAFHLIQDINAKLDALLAIQEQYRGQIENADGKRGSEFRSNRDGAKFIAGE